MTPAYLIQTLVSFLAILVLVGIAWWAKIARHAPDLDEASARALIADEFPDHAIGAVWVAADHRAALARSGDEALIVYRAGDGYVARSLPWARLGEGKAVRDGVALKLADFTAPRARFALAEGATWPPALGDAP
jgi:hypothetical protein